MTLPTLRDRRRRRRDLDPAPEPRSTALLDALEAAFADGDVAPVEELDDLPDDVTSAGDLDDEVTS
ncbi:MAG: hypothetical protein M9894_23950 [Planctomycetes bacterium]|nr:hypothetical protein [Planctomycetota bacterium]